VLVPSERSSAVLVMISSKSESICNRSCARLVDIAEIACFEGVATFDALIRRINGVLFEPRGSKLTLLKFTFNC